MKVQFTAQTSCESSNYRFKGFWAVEKFVPTAQLLPCSPITRGKVMTKPCPVLVPQSHRARRQPISGCRGPRTSHDAEAFIPFRAATPVPTQGRANPLPFLQVWSRRHPPHSGPPTALPASTHFRKCLFCFLGCPPLLGDHEPETQKATDVGHRLSGRQPDSGARLLPHTTNSEG